ncbi:hypothetical protein SLG_03240 [Sphingobium sp. SYK-6]|uniref:hypothetical protein n=1 Tax=Sphingobium sp. (strain NBRC 103272 / SYK-6) TaxID=627192 RepID=UPI0002276DDC|nr:hypothetical protein [Sphingobium sp. SYK-6]BAK64999.1 hypothetical protein SLG_03240 [Sphingobium sp. SYK-6]
MRFHEEQRFSPGVLAAVLAVIGAVAIAALVSAPRNEVAGALALLAAVAGILAILQYAFRLVTRVDETEIEFGFPAGLRRRVPLTDIAQVEAVAYRPLRDFGGWGLRVGREGRMYSARGNRAVKIVLRNGKVLFIGSQQPEKLAGSILAAL